MPRLLLESQLLPIPQTEMTKSIAEAIEIASLLYVYDSGMLDSVVREPYLQMALLGGAYTAYDRLLLSPNSR